MNANVKIPINIRVTEGDIGVPATGFQDGVSEVFSGIGNAVSSNLFIIIVFGTILAITIVAIILLSRRRRGFKKSSLLLLFIPILAAIPIMNTSANSGMLDLCEQSVNYLCLSSTVSSPIEIHIDKSAMDAIVTETENVSITVATDVETGFSLSAALNNPASGVGVSISNNSSATNLTETPQPILHSDIATPKPGLTKDMAITISVDETVVAGNYTAHILLSSIYSPCEPEDDYILITDSDWYNWEQGTIASGNGQNRNDSEADTVARFRVIGALPVDADWSTLKFEIDTPPANDGTGIFVFAYDEHGAFLAPRTAFVRAPYVYNIPATATHVRYVVAQNSSGLATDPITATDFVNAVRISYGEAPRPTTGSLDIVDPAWYAWEQGTIAGANGNNSNGASNLLSRFRSVGYLSVDPSQTTIRFENTASNPTGDSSVGVFIFAYDDTYTYLGRTSGAIGFPATYDIPADTAYIRYVVARGSTTDPIVATDYTNHISISYIWDIPVDPDTSICRLLSSYNLTKQNIVSNSISTAGISGGQGANFVNGNLWYSSASTDGHATTNGTANVYSVNWETSTFTRIHTFTHNFGHMNSFAYDSTHDNLIFGNGSSSYTQLPQFFVAKVGNMNLDGANTLDSVGATVFNVPTDFGAKCNVIWTDVKDIAVMMTDDAKVVRRIRLARGDEILSLGTYTATSTTGYNGTWEVLSEHRINTPYEVLQGAAFLDGKILMGFGHGPLSIGVVELLNGGMMDYKVWEQTSDTSYFGTVWYDEVTGRYGGIRGGRVWIWDSLPFTFTN